MQIVHCVLVILCCFQSCITFEVRYFSPDGKVGMWDTEEFTNPLTDFSMDDMDGEDDAESRAKFALAETASLRSTNMSQDGYAVIVKRTS